MSLAVHIIKHPVTEKIIHPKCKTGQLLAVKNISAPVLLYGWMDDKGLSLPSSTHGVASQNVRSSLPARQGHTFDHGLQLKEGHY